MTINKISLPIFFIGFASFCVNISTVMLFSLSGIYLRNVLGVGSEWIGFLEGAVEAFSYLVKLFSGVISDMLSKRKLIISLGFLMIALARPLVSISSSFWGVFLGRFLDRLGNGLQATPRDALVADLASSVNRGASFGVRQALGTFGSFVGAVLAMVLMSLTNNNVQVIFLGSIIPVLIGLLAVWRFVPDPINIPKKTSDKKKNHSFSLQWSVLKKLPRSYWTLIGITFIYVLARIGEQFLILHATTNFGLPIAKAPIIALLYNISTTIVSYPVGMLADRFSRTILLIIGFVFLILADSLLVFAPNLWVLLIGVVFWGIQIGITQSVSLTMIADFTPVELRGTSFGFFHLVSALGFLLSATTAGYLIKMFDERMAFFSSLLVACIGLMVLLMAKKCKWLPSLASNNA
jgi:MFS family permease